MTIPEILSHETVAASGVSPPARAWSQGFSGDSREDLGQPCAEEATERTVNYAAERADRFDPEEAVLIHGDAHAHNLLQVPGSADDSANFRLVDPEGLVCEPARDSSSCVSGSRCWQT